MPKRYTHHLIDMVCILVHDNKISDIHAYQEVHIVLQFGRNMKFKMITFTDDFPVTAECAAHRAEKAS